MSELELLRAEVAALKEKLAKAESRIATMEFHRQAMWTAFQNACNGTWADR